MNKKLLIILTCVILFIIIFPVQSISNTQINNNNINCLLLEGGWLEKINGINVIHLNGSFYDMGYQYGYLLKEEIVENLRAYNYYLENILNITYDTFFDLWNIQKNYVSQDIIDFIQGTADGADLSFDYVAVTWVYDGGIYLYRCCSFSSWGTATKNNELYCARSFEWMLDVKDPISGTYIQENPVLVVANPENGYSFFYPTVAGHVIEGGINEEGVSVTNMWSENNDRIKLGKPMGVRLFEALYKASTAEEAIEIITSNRTFGYNFVVSDGDVPIGYAVETTANHSYFGTWDNPTESNRPFWQINHAVRRTNFYLDSKLATFQRHPYNSRSLLHILGILGGSKSWFLTWLHYKALSKGIERYWGNIDLNKTMEIIRGVYQLRYDIVWRLFINLWGRYRTMWQWAACPQTGDFLIAYSDVGKYAWECPINYFNLFNLLESEPPP